MVEYVNSLTKLMDVLYRLYPYSFVILNGISSVFHCHQCYPGDKCKILEDVLSYLRQSLIVELVDDDTEFNAASFFRKII